MYPTKQVNFISFRDQPGKVSVEPNRIVCCGDHSVYEPAEGARVVAGPAPQPLATILLEYEPPSDGLTAVGTFGGEMFEEFFRRYAFKLALEHGGQERAHEAVAGATVVAPLAHYCRQNVTC